MKIVVTGSAGFIGRHIASAYASEGHEVIGVDKERLPSTDAELGWHQVVGDITRSMFYYWLDSIHPDVVNHHAAFVYVPGSWIDPAECFQVNTAATASIASYCAAQKAQLIYASSCAVYGNQSQRPVTYEEPVQPSSPYAVSKYASEKLIRAYGSRGLASVIFRYANVYGPGQAAGAEGGVVAKFVDAAKRPEGRVLITGNGQQVRDFVHVKDVVRANVAALGRPTHHPINIGTGVPVSIWELYNIVKNTYRADMEYDAYPARLDDAAYSCLETSLARHALGWRPTILIDEGIKDV